jgi:prepilin signal peptidase PulO-like enzyme (type II secretory pathway)
MLAAIDLVPVMSWVILRGRCRYCRAPISWQNPAIEASVSIVFVFSYVAWPFALHTWQARASFGLWLIYMVLLAALFVYDLRWMILPDALVFLLIALGCLDVALRLSVVGNLTFAAYAQQVLLGGGAFGGIYLLLYIVSRGRWIGFGDVKLGLFMGMVLGWEHALFALFFANVLVLAAVVPARVAGKLSAKSRVPFAPFLIIAFVLNGLLGAHILV